MSRKSKFSREEGTVIILAALVFVVAVGFAALAVDVGMLLTARTELQNAMDAAALAGASKLELSDYDGARQLASQFASLNTVLGQPVQVDPNTDVVFGVYDIDAKEFTALADLPPGTIPDSMQISASANVPFLFAPVLGFSSTTIGSTSASVASQADKFVMLVLDRSGSMDDDSPCFDTTDTIEAGMYSRYSSSYGGYYYMAEKGWFYLTDWTYLPAGTLYGMDYSYSYGWYTTTKWVKGPAQPLTDAKDAAEQFVSRLDLTEDKCGLVSYATSANTDLELSQSGSAIINAIRQFPPGGYTNIGGGMQDGITELTSARAQGFCRKVMILLSDGVANIDQYGSYSTSGGRQYALDRAEVARANGILVFTISVGAGADRSLMQQIAHTTGAAEYFATTGSELPDIFNQIFERVPPQLTM